LMERNLEGGMFARRAMLKGLVAMPGRLILSPTAL
jgi:hypothetical protein